MTRRLIPLLVLSFGITLAVVIGQRMSSDAMAVMIGVVVGVAASVPTSLLLVALVRRERSGTPGWQQEPPPAQLPQPNFIVLNPADLGAARNAPAPMPPPNLQIDGGLRRLRVVGDDDDWN
jgi:hypothetical protein